jgi:hypothetical protein
MYASDLTHRKRAAAIYRNLQLHKEWFASGETIRILGQKGGNDYSYMMELEQGCNQDQCWKSALGVQVKSGNGPMIFDPSNMTNIDLLPLNAGGSTGNPFEYGDYEYSRTIPPVINETLDDGNIQIPMYGNDFYFFGYNAGAVGEIFWNSNNAIFFGPISSIPNTNYQSLMSFGPTDGFRDDNNRGFVPTFGKYILLGNYERRLKNFYTYQYRTLDSKYYISKFTAVFDDYFNYDQLGSNIIPRIPPAPQGIFSVRLIRELVGANRQWIEVSVIQSPPTAGYINDLTISYPSGTYTARDSSGNSIVSPASSTQYNGRPVDDNGNLIDPTKISPYDICNGNILLHICGTIFSYKSPPSGTSFIFESDSKGSNWSFKNNAYLPIY